MARKNIKAGKEEAPKYEDVAEAMREHMDKFEAFYFASLMKSGEHGKDGQRDGLYATLWGLREKVGLEGILKGLEAQAEASIEHGDGLNARYDLANQIDIGAKVFFEAYTQLKPEDIAKYVKDRLNVDIEVRGNKTIKEILEAAQENKATEEEVAYANYLLSQGRNAVIAKMVPFAYQERARRENERFKEKYSAEKKEKVTS